MNFRGFVINWLIVSVYLEDGSSAEPQITESYEKVTNRDRENVRTAYTPSDTVTSTTAPPTPNNDILYNTCTYDDFSCLAMAASDRLGLEAISSLHRKLDDDANGNVDLSESDDFLREELKYDSGYERRQQAFHRNDDTHISVKELWEAWLRSEVHNWTIEQTTDWLATCVELPQYVPNFIQHKVTGAHLPRLAVNNMHFLSGLGIKDPIHKQKISLKAMDVVLFGPPKDGQPHWKDLTLIVLTIAAAFGIWYAVQQNKKFRNHLNRMNKDMDSLQNAEKALENLQKELEVAKQAQETVITEKENLEKILKTGEIETLHTSYSDLEVSELKAEIEMLRNELQIAEGELKDRCWSPPPGLQQWLQLTHEIENKAYIKKKISAEKQLQQAREACEKLRKKRSSLVGAFVSTHGKSIDEVDRSIVEARTSLNEVTQELQERVHRWKQIEMLCGFNIINNNGLQFLENALYRNVNGRSLVGFKVGRMSSQDDLDDDTSSLYGAPQGFSDIGGHSQNKEGDSSGSEVSRQDEDSLHLENKHSVQFLIGGEVTNWNEEAGSAVPALKPNVKPTTPRSVSNNNISINTKPANNNMVRSISHDVNVGQIETVSRPKSAHSDTSLDNNLRLKFPTRQTTTIKEQPAVSAASLEEDVCSTDSSVVDEEIKKKKRKLFTFSKKSKAKGD